MSLSGQFLATHTVPPPGIITYPAADPGAVPGPQLEGGLVVQVLEQRSDGWARIACSNGWQAWADGRLLTPVPLRVPNTGLATYPTPDPGSTRGPSLSARLQVTVLEQREDGWARISCSNGWQAWGDGRLLVRTAPVTTSGRAPESRSVGPTPGRRSLGVVGYTPALTGAGAVLVLVGSFLPWYSIMGTGISSWKVSFLFLLFSNTTAQPHVGLVLVAAVILTAAWFVTPLTGRPPLPREVPGVGAALAVGCGVLYLLRWLHHPAGLGLGIGAFVAMAGGVLGASALYPGPSAGRRY